MSPDQEHVVQRFLEALVELPLEGAIGIDNRRWAQIKLRELRVAARALFVEIGADDQTSDLLKDRRRNRSHPPQPTAPPLPPQQALLRSFLTSIATMPVGAPKGVDARMWSHKRLREVRQAARAWRDRFSEEVPDADI